MISGAHVNLCLSQLPHLSNRDKTSCFFVFCFFFKFFLIFSPIMFISWRLITLQYCSGFCHTLTWISHGFTCVPHPDPPSHFPPHPIWVIPVHQSRALVSRIQPWLAICFSLDNIHVSMLFSQIIPPSPSPIESKSLFYTSMSLSSWLFKSLTWGISSGFFFFNKYS